MITVVIPLFNKALNINRAINSALSQNIAPREIIVVDDGSTDGGGNLVKAYNNPRIRIIRQNNQGEGAARNRGIQSSNADLIAFLDADDAWETCFLEVILRLRKEYPNAGAYATAYKIITPKGLPEIPEFKIFPIGQKEGLIENFFKVGLSFPVWSSAVAAPKKVLEEIGGFPLGEAMGPDVDTWLRIALRYPIAWSNQYSAIYCQDATNRAVGFKRWSKEPVISRTARKAIYQGRVPPDQVQDLREYTAHFQISAARDCLVLGKKETALQLLQYAQGTKKFTREWWLYRLIAAIPGNNGPRLWRVKQSLKGWVR